MDKQERINRIRTIAKTYAHFKGEFTVKELYGFIQEVGYGINCTKGELAAALKNQNKHLTSDLRCFDKRFEKGVNVYYVKK